MRSSFVFSLLAVVVPALAAPTLTPIIKRAGPYKPDSYIITFKDGTSKSAAVEALKQKFAEPGSQSELTYEYSVFNGLAARLAEPDSVSWVQMLPGVAFIEQDQIMSISYEHGIDGLSNGLTEVAAASPLVERADGGNGGGVTVYGIDTGIYIAHNCFGGRASWGATFGDNQQKEGDVDLNGHGTHTAGTAVGAGYGVADGATIKAVKVLDGEGSGALSDVTKGVDWSYSHFQTLENKNGVATMSLGGLAIGSQALKAAVGKAIEGGLHFTVAAGNDNLPANLYTPANVQAANTIGAVDSSNKKASFSNFGPLIDVWAPGVNIESAWIGSSNAKNTISGTSMATPHVAGILAAAISKHGNKSPSALSEDLKKNAKRVVTGALLSNDLLATAW